MAGQRELGNSGVEFHKNKAFHPPIGPSGSPCFCGTPRSSLPPTTSGEAEDSPETTAELNFFCCDATAVLSGRKRKSRVC